MKEALVIFIALLVLLLIVSVFGGSIRYTPQGQAATPSTFPQTMQMQTFVGSSKPTTSSKPKIQTHQQHPATASSSASRAPSAAPSAAPSVPGGNTQHTEMFAPF